MSSELDYMIRAALRNAKRRGYRARSTRTGFAGETRQVRDCEPERLQANPLLTDEDGIPRAMALFEGYLQEYTNDEKRQQLVRLVFRQDQKPGQAGPPLGFNPIAARSIVHRFRKKYLTEAAIDEKDGT